MSLIVHKTKPLAEKKLAKIPARVKWGGMDARRKKNGTSANGWKGVRHAALLEVLKAEIHKAAKLTGHTSAWTAHNDGDLAACFRAQADGMPFGTQWVGVTASNISLARLKVYCGVVAEDGTRLVSEVLTGSAYNKNFDLDAECKTLAHGWREGVRKCVSDEHDFKRLRLAPSESDRLILTAGRENLIPWKYLGRLDRAYADRKDTTGWDLLWAFSQVVSACPPLTQLPRLFAFRSLLAKKVALLKPEVA